MKTNVFNAKKNYPFTFEYPADKLLLTESSKTFSLFDEIIPGEGIILSHEINTEHCDESGLPGHCTPKTSDIEISVYTLNKTVQKIHNNTDQIMDNVRLGNYDALRLEQGVEGEGIIYYFISLNDKKTIMVSRKYIDENIVAKYKAVPEFITSSESKKIFENIMQTLKLSTI